MESLDIKLLEVGVHFEKNVRLDSRTWLKTGGVAGIWIAPENRKQLVDAVFACLDCDLAFDVIGSTTNIFCLSTYKPEIVISTTRVKDFSDLSADYLDCDCGVPVASLASYCVQKGYQGFSGLIGLPGTVGAAIVNNSSCFGCSVSDLVRDVEFLDYESRTIVRLSPERLNYSFRSSSIKRKELKGVVISSRLLKIRGDATSEMSRSERAREERKRTQEPPAHTLGSIFSELSLKSGLRANISKKLGAVCRICHFNVKKHKKNILLSLYGYCDLKPYVSDKNINTFIFDCSKGRFDEKKFFRYESFVRKAFDNPVMEIEVRGRRQRVLIIHPDNDHTGSTRVLTDVIQRRFSDSDVTVLTKNNTDAHGLLSDVPGISIINSYCRPTVRGHRILVISECIYRINQFVRAYKYCRGADLVYVNTIIPFYGAVVAKLLKKRLVYHIHEVLENRNMEIRIARMVFDRVRAERVFVSQYTKSGYADNGSLSSVQYNRLPRSFVEKICRVPLDIRKRNTILMLCAFSNRKGVWTFVDLAARLPRYRFVLVAVRTPEGPSKQFIDSCPSNLSVFLGQNDVHPFFEDSDMLVNLSIPSLCVETFGMTLLEGMSYGLPVIAPNVGGPTELIEDGVDGYCLDVCDINVVAEMIAKILVSPEEYNRLSHNASLKAEMFY